MIRNLERPVINTTKLVLLTDCSSAHASIHAIQPRSTDRSTRVLLDYIRDRLQFICITFSDAGFSLSDVGTKALALKEPWLKLVKENKFEIGFLVRKKYQELRNIPYLPRAQKKLLSNME